MRLTIRTPALLLPLRSPLAGALAAGLLVAGCGSSATTTTKTTTSTAAKPPAATRKHGKAPAKPTPAPKHTGSKPATHPKAAAPKTHPGHVIRPVVIKTGALLQTLKGSGDQPIGNLTENAAVVLEWKATKPPIQIFNEHAFVLVNSPSATGEVRLARGKYIGLRVATKGAWTLEIRASG